MARLLSVNTNMRREFRKVPRSSGRLLKDFGLEGDRHAGRPQRQVSLLESETIADLAARAMPVAPGILGENLTVEGLPLGDLPVGTLIAIGEAQLEITGDRPACKDMLAIHRDALKAMIGRSGKMARVVRGGRVRPGDPVSIQS